MNPYEIKSEQSRVLYGGLQLDNKISDIMSLNRSNSFGEETHFFAVPPLYKNVIITRMFLQNSTARC